LIPQANEHLSGFVGINKNLATFSSLQQAESTATLDMDATLVATSKAEALFCYKGYKSYQPLNTWWAEQEIIAREIAAAIKTLETTSDPVVRFAITSKIMSTIRGQLLHIRGGELRLAALDTGLEMEVEQYTAGRPEALIAAGSRSHK
jgi:hypothetical protein